MKSLYFKYSKREKEIFDELFEELYEIDITEGKHNHYRPFQSVYRFENKINNTITARLDLSDWLSNHLIAEETVKKEINKMTEDIVEDIFEATNGLNN